MIKRLAVLGAVLFAVSLSGGLASPAWAQALPPSLQGESFMAVTQPSTFGGGIGTAHVSSTCTNSGQAQTATISYTADGPAYGPYPGTFTESGTATVALMAPVGPAGSAGPVTQFQVNFAIDSPVGHVTGTKTLLTTDFGAGICQFDPPYPFGEVHQATATLSYEATIQTSAGSFHDQGKAYVFARRWCFVQACPGNEIHNFTESFLLSSGVLPLDTTGKATGGGQLRDVTKPSPVTFGFEVKQPELGQLQGRCNVIDHTTGTKVKCLDATSYQQIGNTASWTGNATVNGQPETYRITVQDNGEPNQGVDTFSIKTDTYQASGNVEHGNVQLHKQTP